MLRYVLLVVIIIAATTGIIYAYAAASRIEVSCWGMSRPLLAHPIVVSLDDGKLYVVSCSNTMAYTAPGGLIQHGREYALEAVVEEARYIPPGSYLLKQRQLLQSALEDLEVVVYDSSAPITPPATSHLVGLPVAIADPAELKAWIKLVKSYSLLSVHGVNSTAKVTGLNASSALSRGLGIAVIAVLRADARVEATINGSTVSIPLRELVAKASSSEEKGAKQYAFALLNTLENMLELLSVRVSVKMVVTPTRDQVLRLLALLSASAALLLVDYKRDPEAYEDLAKILRRLSSKLST